MSPRHRPLTSPATNSGRSTVYAPNAIIATSQPLATSAGLEIMRRGGNAIDAAIAAAAVLSVTEPHMTGLGGDMFSMLWSAREKKLVGITAAGPAGSLISRKELLRRGYSEMPTSGAESVTVPGALAGWTALLDRYGSLSLREVLGPAIRLAADGFPVTPIIASDWARQETKLRADEGSAATFLISRERAPRVGEWFANPDLAETLSAIAEGGGAALYGGHLGQSLVDGVRELDGFLTYEDLGKVRVEWVDPLGVNFGEYRLYELPPPGQGIAALQMLKLLGGFDLTPMGHNSADYLHHLIEPKKIAYADLAAHVADPYAMHIPPQHLIDTDYLEQRRLLIDPRRSAERVEPGREFTEGDTVYLAAADEEGNMISFINSIYSSFGSGVTVPGTGFMLQNRGAGFTLQEGHPNTVEGGKRPFHTLMPGFVTRVVSGSEEPWLAFGVMGGPMQPQGQIQVLLNVALFGMDPQEANDAVRFQHTSGRKTGLEAAISPQILQGLEALGHEITVGGAFGGCQMVMKLSRGWAASSDVRKDGHAGGY